MSNFLFNRIAKLIVGTEEEQALVFNNDFKMSFDIQKNRTSLPNIATFQIWNLAKSTRNKLNEVSKQHPVIFSAGYKEGDGLELLFNGQITRIVELIQPPNIITKIECGDGAIPLSQQTLALTYRAGINSNDIIRQIADSMKLDISSASDYINQNVSFAHGEAFNGLAKDFLDKIAQATDLDWHINDNQIVLTRKKTNKKRRSNATNQTAVLISPETGMIKSPQILNDTTSSISSFTPEDGWTITCLLLPDVTPGRKIRIESEVIKDDFVVSSVEHKGDNWESDWTTIIQTDTFNI